jgi:glycosyltransferase involved in cell wall biosynthesis
MDNKKELLFFHDNYVLGGDTNYLGEVLKKIHPSQFTLIYGSSSSVKKHIMKLNIEPSSLIALRLFNPSFFFHLISTKCKYRLVRFIFNKLIKVISPLLIRIVHIRLKLLLEKNDIEKYKKIIINSGGFWGSEVSRQFLKLIDRNDCIYIIHNHIPDLRNNPGAFSSIDKNINNWITGSKTVEKQLLYDHRVNPDSVHYVPYGVKPKIKPLNIDHSRLYNKFGINKNDFVIIHPSGFIKRHGHYYTLSAFKDFNKNVKNSKLILAGGEGEYKDQVKKLVSSMHLNNDVIFTGYYTPIEELIVISDLVCLPSQEYGGMPLVLSLGLACKTPILTTSGGDFDDYLSDEYNAFLVKVNDYKTITKKFNKLYTDEKLKNNLIINGFNTYKKYFLEEHMVTKTINLLRK